MNCEVSSAEPRIRRDHQSSIKTPEKFLQKQVPQITKPGGSMSMVGVDGGQGGAMPLGVAFARARAGRHGGTQARSISTGMETWFPHCRRRSRPLMQAVCMLFLGRCVAVGLSTYCPIIVAPSMSTIHHQLRLIVLVCLRVVHQRHSTAFVVSAVNSQVSSRAEEAGGSNKVRAW